jgi:hypothetical protein
MEDGKAQISKRGPRKGGRNSKDSGDGREGGSRDIPAKRFTFTFV